MKKEYEIDGYCNDYIHKLIKKAKEEEQKRIIKIIIKVRNDRNSHKCNRILKYLESKNENI